MKYDVKKDIYAVVSDDSLSINQKIERIKDIYNSSEGGAARGSNSGNPTKGGDITSGDDTNSNNGKGSGQRGSQGGQQGQQGQQGGQNNDAIQEAINAAQQAVNAAQHAVNAAQQGGQQGQQSGQQGQQGSQGGQQGQQSGQSSGQSASSNAVQSANAAHQAANSAQQSSQNGSAQQSANSAQQAADAAQQAADAAQQAAQQSGSKSAQQAADAAQQAANAAQQAADAAQDAAKNGDAQSTKQSTQQAANAAHQAANAAQQSASQNSSSNTSQQTNSTQNSVNAAQQAANSAQQSSQNGSAQQSANSAQQAADAAQQAADAAQQAADAAQQAAQQSGSKSAQQSANSAQQAADAAQQAADDAQQAADDAQQAADNNDIKSAQRSAQQAANAAQQAANAAQQAANASQQVADNTQNNSNNLQSKQSAQQSAKSAQQSANSAQQAADAAQQAADAAQQAADAAQQAAQQSGSKSAQQSAKSAQQAADDAQQAANAAQQAADNNDAKSAQQSAQQAADATQQAANAAQQAANSAQQAMNNSSAQQAAQQSGSKSAQQAADAAQQAADAAQQAAQQSGSKSAQQAADAAQQAADAAQQAADAAQQAAQQSGSKSAQQAADAAQQAADAAQQAADAAQQAAQRSGSNSAQQAADAAQQAANAAHQAANAAHQAANAAQQSSNQQSNSQNNQQNNNSSNSDGDMMSMPDNIAYAMGKEYGKKYAQDIYANNGFKPLWGNMIDLPSVEDIKIIGESLNESIDSEMYDLLSNKNISLDDIVSKIHDLYFNDIDMGTTKEKNDVQKNSIDKNAIVSRNGLFSVKDGKYAVDDHIISKSVGDEIRKELGITPRDPNFGMSSDEESAIKEAFPILDKVFSSNRVMDPEMLESANKLKNKIKGRIRQSREGVIDWKRALARFVSTCSKKMKKGPIRKNIYTLSGVAVKHQIKDRTNYNTCVVYIDTSGSVNNSQTQLIPVMAGEICKIMKDCKFNTVDIHLFDDDVYTEHFGVNVNKVKNKDWGIEGVSDGGGTDIQKVYRHIQDNYTFGGRLKKNVDAIIIITDVSGMQGGGSIKPYASKFNEDLLRRMLYVIYNDYSNKYISEVREEMGSLVSEYSTHYEISLENFKKQILNEDMRTNVNSRITKIDEILGSANDIKRTMNKPKVNRAERSEEESNAQLKKIDIQYRRDNDSLEEIAGDIINVVKTCFPQCDKMVKEMSAVYNNDNVYFVTDELHVVINCNFTRSNRSANYRQMIRGLIEASKKIIIDAIIGDVSLTSMNFDILPSGFSSIVIEGDLIVEDCEGLMNARGMLSLPTNVSGTITIIPPYGISDEEEREFDEAVEQYKAKLGKKVKNLIVGDNGAASFKPVFTRSDANESVAEIVRKRMLIGESYLNEAFPSNLKPLSRTFLEKNNNSAQVYRKNKEIFDNVFNNENGFFRINWGNLTEDDIQIHRVVSNLSRNDKNGYRTILASKTYNNFKSLVNGKSRKHPGIKMFVDSNYYIRMIYAEDVYNDKTTILLATDENGDYTIDKDEIKYILNKRNEFAISLYKGCTNTYGDVIGEMIDYGTFLYWIFFMLYKIMSIKLGDANGNAVTDISHDILNYSGNGFDYSDAANILGIDDVYIKKSTDNSKPRGFARMSFYQGGEKGGQDKAWRAQTIDDAFDVYKRYRDSDSAIFEALNPEFLRLLLMGMAVRFVDDYPEHTVDEIENASEQALVDIAVEWSDVLVATTIWKCMTGVDKNIADNVNYESTVLIRFPDYCEYLYDINVDVPADIDRRVQKSNDRLVNRIVNADMSKLNGYFADGGLMQEYGQRAKRFVGLLTDDSAVDNYIEIFNRNNINAETQKDFVDAVKNLNAYVGAIVQRIAPVADRLRGRDKSNYGDFKDAFIAAATQQMNCPSNVAEQHFEDFNDIFYKCNTDLLKIVSSDAMDNPKGVDTNINNFLTDVNYGMQKKYLGVFSNQTAVSNAKEKYDEPRVVKNINLADVRGKIDMLKNAIDKLEKMGDARLHYRINNIADTINNLTNDISSYDNISLEDRKSLVKMMRDLRGAWEDVEDFGVVKDKQPSGFDRISNLLSKLDSTVRGNVAAANVG